MKKLIAASLVAAWLIGFAVGPAEAVSRHSRRGAAFTEARGTCDLRKHDGIAKVRCGLDDRKRLHYKFRVPQDAFSVRVRVDYYIHDTCCGTTKASYRRHGTHRRLVLAEVRVWNYGNPLGYYRSSIRRVTVLYERP